MRCARSCVRRAEPGAGSRRDDPAPEYLGWRRQCAVFDASLARMRAAAPRARRFRGARMPSRARSREQGRSRERRHRYFRGWARTACCNTPLSRAATSTRRRFWRPATPLTPAGRRNWLVITEGNETDFSRIEDDILELCKRFKVRSVAYDPWAATQLAQRLSSQNVPVVEFRATTAQLLGADQGARRRHAGRAHRA